MSNYVTEALGRALLDLMREKSIEKITVDELTTRAKLGRATYFRNFNAKEEIITQYIVILWRAYERTHHLKDYRIDDPYRVCLYFEFCLSMRADNDVIMTQNRSSAILSAYEIIFYDYDEPMASDTFERAYMAYGLFGVFLKWAKDGYRQTVEDMTSMFLALHMQSDIIYTE